MSDRLHDTLSALRTDVDSMPLADSSAVRARGAQRTRRQAVGSSLAVVALIAGAVGISGALTGNNNKASDLPADNPTVTTTQQEPSPRPSVTEEKLQLAADPYLRGDDLTGIGPYEAFQRNGELPEQLQMQCMDVVALGQGAKRTGMVFFEDTGDATLHENLFEFPNSAAAEEFVTDIGSTFAACDPGDPAEVTVEDRGPAPVGDQGAVRASRLSTPTADAGIGYYELGVIREANIVVVLEWSSMGNPEDTGWVWDAGRLQTALNRALG
jgi:hypothetical protein